MGTKGRYGHGKSKGVSDLVALNRLHSAGEVGGQIKPFTLEQPPNSTPAFNVGDTYFRSLPLDIPGPITIPDAPLAPDTSQNEKNLANWIGQVRTDISQTGESFWNLQAALDASARRIAEKEYYEGKDEAKQNLVNSQKELNKAKNIIEGASKNDAEAKHSYGVLASLDKRTEREYGVVKAKDEAMSVIQGLGDYMKGEWKKSTQIDDGKGVIAPYSLPTQEDLFGMKALEYINASITNPQAKVELQREIQAAIYSARTSVGALHSTWVDGRANDTYKTGTSLLIKQSLDTDASNDLGDGKKGTELVNNFVNGSSSNENFQTLKTNILGIWVKSSIVNIPAANFAHEIQNVRNELLNTRIGPGENDFLWKAYGGPDELIEAFNLAVNKAKNDKGNINDAAAKDRGTTNGNTDFQQNLNNHDDGDLDLEGTQDVLITLPNSDVVFKQKTNIQMMNDSALKLKIDALKTMPPGPERDAYIQAIDDNLAVYMGSYGVYQQKENYEWLLKTIDSSKPVYWRARIKEMELNNQITRFQSQDLLQHPVYGLEDKIKIQQSTYAEGNKAPLKQLKTALDGYYRTLGDENRTTSDEQVLIQQQLGEVNEELGRILGDTTIDFKTKQEKALTYINSVKDQINTRNIEAQKNKQGLNTDTTKQEGSNQSLTINDSGAVNTINNKGGATNNFVGTTPLSIVKVLGGKRDKQENLALSNSITRAPLYSKTIFKNQLLALEQEFERREEAGITGTLDWEVLIKQTRINNLRIAMQRRNEGKVPIVQSKLPLRVDTLFGSRYPQGRQPVISSERVNIDLQSTATILNKIDEHQTPKEYFINQMNVHGIEVNEDMMEMLDNLWPEEKVSSALDEGILVAGTNLEGVLPNPKKELETNMLNILYRGESTVDTKHGGYEAFNQGGTDEGKTVLGFSGTYGDHPANKGKKLTEMTIQEILDIQDSGYNFDIYPKGEAGTKKWHDSGGIHAAGRYQLLRGAIRDAMRLTGIKPTEKFTPEIQDRLGLAYLLQFGPSKWTSMEKKENIKLRKELDKLLEQYKKPEKTESSTINSKSDIA
tara:strand:+ start:4603 stop:7779 length:3177 start_codon:yes stop_codon:yes gene_type:complete